MLDRAALSVPSADALGPFINIILNPNSHFDGRCLRDWSYIKEHFAVARNNSSTHNILLTTPEFQQASSGGAFGGHARGEPARRFAPGARRNALPRRAGGGAQRAQTRTGDAAAAAVCSTKENSHFDPRGRRRRLVETASGRVWLAESARPGRQVGRLAAARTAQAQRNAARADAAHI